LKIFLSSRIIENPPIFLGIGNQQLGKLKFLGNQQIGKIFGNKIHSK